MHLSLLNQVIIHQVTTMLATSENVLFPGHNHLLTTSTDNPTLWLLPTHQQEIFRTGYHGGYLVDNQIYCQNFETM